MIKPAAMNANKTRQVFGLIVLLTAFLFFGGPANESHRIYQAFWDTGHVILFMLLGGVVLHMPPLVKKSWFVKWGLITIFCLATGLLIEGLQLLVNRTFDVRDVLNDLLGGYAALLLTGAMQARTRAIQWLLTLSAVSVLLLGYGVFIAVVIDHFLMQQDFPVLADFEGPLQLTRWDTKLARLSYSRHVVRHGQGAMKVEFQPGDYPDITLISFPPDWRGYETVRFSLYQAMDTPLTMELKVYDRAHRHNDYRYSDRFNRELILSPGWNDVSVSLNDVKNAPMGRVMDMTVIASISLFLHDLKQPMTLYLDDLYLSN